MKGSPKVLVCLQDAVKSELQAIQQYVLHSALAENSGFPALARQFAKVSRVEMEHLDSFLDRMTFLEGAPMTGMQVEIKSSVAPQAELQYNLQAEMSAVDLYAQTIVTCVEESDEVTANLFRRVMAEEQDHANYLETELRKIKAIGAPYLAELASGE